jgi:hypothetical protein
MVTFKDNAPKKDPNNGIHTYEGSEIANIGMGQNGFDILFANNDYVEEDATVTGSCLGNWTRGWVAIKVIGGAACKVEGTSNVGDDLTDGTAVDGSSGINISDTDVVYGNFKKILLQTVGSNSIVICYRG